ncbi:MAG: hypothetical protein EA351_11390 [Gemmatimonadales bacterium]|nr:MAG: hypothetical protein EA351_11390 [Gemmatimonadales bacterium]
MAELKRVSGFSLVLLLLVPWVPPADRVLGSAMLTAQQSYPDSRDRTVRATRVEGPIQIDGRLDEPDWQRAEPTSGFTQREPLEGQPALEDTEVRILYDDENLYIGARMYDSDPSRVARQLTPRGVTGRAAGYFEFSLDPNLDRSTGYTFRVTAAGVQRDQYNYDDTSSDGSWDGIWESAASIDDQGWIAEVRIPLSQIRFNASGETQVWGVNFARRRIADNERSEWAFVPRGVHGNVSRWGRLEGLHLTERRRYSEIVPYVLAGAERGPSIPGDPFFDGSDARTRVGADVRYGLGSTFVLDMALNPDFGQVQVDPRVINLSAFETFLPERRPFFTRDDALFDFGLAGPRDNLFYSRRIGRSPQGRSPVAFDFTQLPSETAIRGAAKVTGRTRGGLSMGGLLALTAREWGRAYQADIDEVFRFQVEPGTVYGTLRAQQDLRDGQTRAGAILTAVDRDLPESGDLDLLARRALTGGVDLEHTWADREWAVSGLLAGSRVTGSEDAILRLQRSSNHYFQRPDRDDVHLDPDATELTGAEWRLQLERRGGRHWTGAAWAGQRTPGFEVNDLGFSTSTERVTGGARLRYQQPDPGERFQNYSFTLFTFHSWRNEVREDISSMSAWGDAYKSGFLSGNASFTLLNWWGLGVNANYSPESFSDVMTRGGPIMIDPASREVGISLNTDRRDDLTYRFSLDYESGARGGREFQADFGIEARPSDAISVSVGPSYRRSLDPAQYVTQLRNVGFEPTLGGRYFFGELAREQISFDTSLDYIFSPNLTLQIFAQPLIAAGEFRGFKQLEALRTFDFIHFSEGEATSVDGVPACVGGEYCRSGGQIHLDYSGDGRVDTSFREQNFNIRSLRGTAALRWEYRPGSRIYLVWQQRRQSRELLGDFDFARDARAMFDAPGEHVFMVKVDYWLDF